MPPPSWAKSATNEAPKPKPTMRNGASATVTSPTNVEYAVKMPHTPRSDRATTRKPETAPPRIATWTASTRLRRAAEAVRTLALTAMNMPMIPDAIEQAAPTMKAKPVMTPIGRPASLGTSATSAVSTMPMTTPMTTAPTIGQDADRRVLAAEERDRTFEDGAGHVLHRLGPRVARQDVPGEVDARTGWR